MYLRPRPRHPGSFFVPCSRGEGIDCVLSTRSIAPERWEPLKWTMLPAIVIPSRDCRIATPQLAATPLRNQNTLWYSMNCRSDTRHVGQRKEPLSEACYARTLTRAGLSSPSLTKGFFLFERRVLSDRTPHDSRHLNRWLGAEDT